MQIDLVELLRRESEQVEWKAQVADVEDVVATIAAFANDLQNLGGGYVVCGARETVGEGGFPAVTKEGLASPRFHEVEGQVLTICREKVDPDLAPLVVPLDSDVLERRVLVFVVPASRRAHAFRHRDGVTRYHVRVGRTTIEARNGLLRELLVRKGEIEPWDRRVCTTASTEDLDLVVLRDSLQRMGVFEPGLGLEAYLDPQRQISPFIPALCDREPISGALRPRNFALLLFGRSIQRWIPGAVSVFSVYPGIDRTEVHAERHDLAGNLLDQVRRLIDLLDVESYTAFDKQDPHSPNATKYPRRALHEAMINALAHRDYERPDPTRVTVFSDRVEIASPGALPAGVTLEKLRSGTSGPRWRNQSLAWILTRLQLAQAEGQGIPTIIRTMREEGCPDPQFDADEARVTCVLPAHPRHALARDYRAIEREISLGNAEEARRRVEEILTKDPMNTRAIAFLAETHRLLGDPSGLVQFVDAAGVAIETLPPIILVSLAEALLALLPHGDSRRAKASRLLAVASRGRFELREARRVAVGLFEAGDDSGALAFLDRTSNEHPEWRQNAAFLQLRGRGQIQQAKKCFNTARNPRNPPQTKRRAWDECRRFLDDAERSLTAALSADPDAFVAEHARKDLEFVRKLHDRSRPPQRRR